MCINIYIYMYSILYHFNTSAQLTLSLKRHFSIWTAMHFIVNSASPGCAMPVLRVVVKLNEKSYKIPQIPMVCFSAGDCDRMGTCVRRWRICARLAKGPVASVVGQQVPGHIQQCGLRRLHQPVCVVRRWIEGTRGRLLSSIIITIYVMFFSSFRITRVCVYIYSYI